MRRFDWLCLQRPSQSRRSGHDWHNFSEFPKSEWPPQMLLVEAVQQHFFARFSCIKVVSSVVQSDMLETSYDANL